MAPGPISQAELRYCVDPEALNPAGGGDWMHTSMGWPRTCPLMSPSPTFLSRERRLNCVFSVDFIVRSSTDQV